VPQPGTRLGSAVALFGTTVLAGAPADTGLGETDAGALHSMILPVQAVDDRVVTLIDTEVVIDVLGNDFPSSGV
jgi:hypothetical protein